MKKLDSLFEVTGVIQMIKFEKKKDNKLLDDINKFEEVNKFGDSFGIPGGIELYVNYAALVESRLTNDLMLIENESLCASLGLDIDNLYAEIEELVFLRKKISFPSIENTKDFTSSLDENGQKDKEKTYVISKRSK